MQIALYEKNIQFSDYIVQQLRLISDTYNVTVVLYNDIDWVIADVSQRLEMFDIAIICQQAELTGETFLAKEIKRFNPNCQIIFISRTGNLQPAYYEVQHVYAFAADEVSIYLPFAVKKSIEIIENLDNQRILLLVNSEKYIVALKEILYFEHVLRKTRVVLTDCSIETYQSIQDLLKLIPQDRFIQCHKSFYVNLRRISRLKTGELRLENGKALPIGRVYQETINSAFKEYLIRPIVNE